MLTNFFYTIFAPFERKLNFQQNPCNISHLTLTLVPHYLGQVKRLIYLKNQRIIIIIIIVVYYELSKQLNNKR